MWLIYKIISNTAMIAKPAGNSACKMDHETEKQLFNFSPYCRKTWHAHVSIYYSKSIVPTVSSFYEVLECISQPYANHR